MFRSLSVCAVALLACGGALQGQQAPRDCSSPEHRAFDFWLGDWEVHSADGKLAGTNHIERKINGCALTENWHGAGGSVGISVNSYDRADGKWHQNWVDGQGGRLVLEGGLEGENMVMRGTRPGAQGGEVLHEISWEPREDGTVRQHWRASRDGGATWQDLFDGIYQRSGAAASSE